MPARSRPRSSVLGLRPTAASRWLPSIVGTPAPAAASPSTTRTPRPPAPGPTLAFLTAKWNATPFALEDRLHLARDLGVLARDQPVAVLEHRDARAEAPVHLRELEADVAAAGDDQVLGQRVERHHRDVGQDRHVADAVPGRQHRPAADVDEDLRRLERLAVDLDRVRRAEAGVAAHQRQVRRRREPLADAFDRVGDDAVLARLDGLHVDMERAVDANAVLAGAPRRRALRARSRPASWSGCSRC